MADRFGLRRAMVVLGAISALLLAMAFGFEAAGFRPCELCILQRWPHAATAALGLVAFLWPGAPRGLALLGALAMVAGLALGIYHSGVEWHLWAGPATCTGTADLRSLSTKDLLDQIMAAPIVRCDQPALVVFGTTMANWNAVASGVLMAGWMAAWRLAAPRG